jgi:hypothetical protein
VGVSFRIYNQPKWSVLGVLDGEEIDKQMEHWEIVLLFEEPPTEAAVIVRTISSEPALPPEAAKLHVGMPYSAFNRLRAKLAAAIGIDLEMMWGFQPSPLRIAEIRGIPTKPLSRLGTYEEFEREQNEWWSQNARGWDTVDNGMAPFLHHSDCDGELTAEQCRAVAPVLAEAIEKMPHDPLEDDRTSDKTRAKALLEMVQACAKYDRDLLFR